MRVSRRGVVLARGGSSRKAMLATEFGSRSSYKDANEAVFPMDDEVL